MAALSVEHLKVRVYLLGGGVSMAALTVEHLKVMAALTVEPACAFNLLIGWGGLDGGLNSRAPKGDGGLNSRAC